MNPLKRYYIRLSTRWHGRNKQPPVGAVDFGDFDATIPISRTFGFDRGVPIDRYYVEKFLETNASLIRGGVLEIADSTYTRRFGGNRVTKSDVLHYSEGAEGATIIGDLANAPHIPDASFDCVILTHTLHVIPDFRPVIRELHRILKPGGCVLCADVGISQISRYDMDRWGDWWRFTERSMGLVFSEVFERSLVDVTTYGNVKSAVAQLEGLCSADLTLADLDAYDPDYQLVVAVAAHKPR